MPTSFDIAASTGRYPVDIAMGSLDALLARQDGDHVFVVDAFLRDRVVAAGNNPIVIAADEAAKSLDRMTDIIVALRDRGATRGTTLVAIGGGVVQDAAAFAASVYMRGLKWVYVPTTLLAMTDSCIGGKSSINVGLYKNLVGTIHPPQRVVVDPDLAGTLSAEQVAAGLCEAAKICLCRGTDYIDRYIALDPSVESSPADLEKIVELSLSGKKWFIEVDEFDRAERLILNFGHTFGHALEAASHFGVGHGIAVGLGMLAAIHMAVALHPQAKTPEITAFRRHIGRLLTSVDGLDDVLATVDLDVLMKAFDSDKKHDRDYYAVILPNAEGQIERRLLPRTDETRRALQQAAATMLTPTAEQTKLAA